ncbi:3-oxoacid CoA-transferase [Amycolatopsis pigmentata]|uniref:3-oxoacid CoA-transferase n=1 Tax=Amycolatopsis pigmentata TaxID=450801 RepID=A0ABW5G310_9PSEU
MPTIYGSPEEAVAEVPNGASVAVSGFGLDHRFPSSLIRALRDTDAKNLTLVCNSLGSDSSLRAVALIESRQVSKLIACFSARPGSRSLAEDLIDAGEMTLELVPQGTLVERLRAGGSGIAGFFTRTGAGTLIADGKETRYFDGEPYIFERALRVDYALIRAYQADTLGNLKFRGASANFNPAFAKAATFAIAEVDEIVEPGTFDPAEIGLPGIFVSGLVKTTVTPGMESVPPPRKPDVTRRRNYDRYGEGLSRLETAQLATDLIPDGSYVNLGVGLPLLIARCIEGRDLMLHAENGLLGHAGPVTGDARDPDYYNAGGQFVGLRHGASVFDSVTSFEMARSARLVVVLGAYQVDADGHFANWTNPSMTGGGIGGAMDLASGAGRLVVVMEHCDKNMRPKLIPRCTFPLTTSRPVDLVVTDLGAFRRVGERYLLERIARPFSVDDLRQLSGFDFDVSRELTAVGVDRVRS